jgi:hypothetical protein
MKLRTSQRPPLPLTRRASLPNLSVNTTRRSWLPFRPPPNQPPRFPPRQHLNSQFGLARVASLPCLLQTLTQPARCLRQTLTQPARCPHRQMHPQERCFPRTLAWALKLRSQHRQMSLPLPQPARRYP